MKKEENISKIPEFSCLTTSCNFLLTTTQKLYKVQHIPLSLSCVVAINFRQHIMLTYVVRQYYCRAALGYIKSEKNNLPR